MKRLIFLVLLLAVGVGGFGFYRGWWSIQSGGQDGKTGLNLTIDKDKIAEDKQKALDKAHSVEQKAEQKVSP